MDSKPPTSIKNLRIYDSDSKFPPITNYAIDTYTYFRFAYEKAKLDLRAANKNTWFGQLWNILNPLLLSMVYFLLVVVIVGNGGSIFDLEGLKVLTQIIGGLFLYRFVSNGLNLGARSIIGGGAFVLNTRLPRMILPLSAMCNALLTFLPSMVVYIAFHAISRHPIGLETFWALPIFIIVFFLTVGLSMLAATGNVYFRDVASFLPYISRIWLYLTPVIYPYTEVPDSMDWFFYANPLGSIFAAWQQVLFEGSSPSPKYILVGIIWSTSLLFLGLFMFLRKEREFAIRI